MSTEGTTPARARALRPLALTWLMASAPTAMAAFMLALVSDRPSDSAPGTVLSLLALSGIGLGTWMIVAPRREALVASLMASATWLVAAAVVYPTQEFVADGIWSAGAPAIAAIVTAVMALAVRRASHRV